MIKHDRIEYRGWKSEFFPSQRTLEDMFFASLIPGTSYISMRSPLALPTWNIDSFVVIFGLNRWMNERFALYESWIMHVVSVDWSLGTSPSGTFKSTSGRSACSNWGSVFPLKKLQWKPLLLRDKLARYIANYRFKCFWSCCDHTYGTATVPVQFCTVFEQELHVIMPDQPPSTCLLRDSRAPCANIQLWMWRRTLAWFKHNLAAKR